MRSCAHLDKGNTKRSALALMVAFVRMIPGVHFLFLSWFHLLLLFVPFLRWLFRVRVWLVLPLLFPAVLFCLFGVRFRGRSLLAVLLALTASCVRLFRLLPSFPFSSLPLAVVCVVLRLLVARLLWCLGVLRRAVCLWRFRLVLVRLRLLRPLPFRVAVRGRGVLWLLLLVWVVLCWWFCLLVLLLRRFLLRLLLASVVWALHLVAVRCGSLFLCLFSFLCSSPSVGGVASEPGRLLDFQMLTLWNKRQ